MLTRQEQMEFILDHYENPRHKGELTDAEASVEGGNPGCGDIIKVYLKVNDGRVVASFEGEGCTISQASASYLMDEVNGKMLDEVLAIDHETLMENLGKEIVQQRTRCATLSLDTLRAAIRKRERIALHSGEEKVTMTIQKERLIGTHHGKVSRPLGENQPIIIHMDVQSSIESVVINDNGKSGNILQKDNAKYEVVDLTKSDDELRGVVKLSNNDSAKIVIIITKGGSGDSSASYETLDQVLVNIT